MPTIDDVKTLEQFQKEFRSKLVAAIAAAVVATTAAVATALWAYLITLPGSIGLVPAGAVVAFWTDRDALQEEGCPSDWVLVEELAGRTIVGAGGVDGSWTRYADGVDGEKITSGERLALTKRAPQDVGGEENHRLTIPEIAGHDHAFIGAPIPVNGTNASVVGRVGSGTKDAAYETFTPAGTIESRGGDQSHNTMSPYMALYYCKKS